MSGHALTVDAVVANGLIKIVDEDFYRTRAARLAKQWGDGRALKVRIEPEARLLRDVRRPHYTEINEVVYQQAPYAAFWYGEGDQRYLAEK